MKTYFRVLASLLLLTAAFPMLVLIFGLFFYEGPFSFRQVAIQTGAQILLFTGIYLCAMAAKWIWMPNVEAKRTVTARAKG